MLKARGIEYHYREYTRDPLSVGEIRQILEMLDVEARRLLRRNDRAFKTLGLTGEEGNEVLIAHMAEHPTLLQRPIGVADGRAAVGRPPENLLELVGRA